MITKMKLFQVDNSDDLKSVNTFFENHEIVQWQAMPQVGKDSYRLFIHYELNTAEEEILKDAKRAEKIRARGKIANA